MIRRSDFTGKLACPLKFIVAIIGIIIHNTALKCRCWCHMSEVQQYVWVDCVSASMRVGGGGGRHLD